MKYLSTTKERAKRLHKPSYIDEIHKHAKQNNVYIELKLQNYSYFRITDPNCIFLGVSNNYNKEVVKRISKKIGYNKLDIIVEYLHEYCHLVDNKKNSDRFYSRLQNYETANTEKEIIALYTTHKSELLAIRFARKYRNRFKV